MAIALDDLYSISIHHQKFNVMKKLVLFSAIVFAGFASFAQSSATFASVKKPEARHISTVPQGGYQGSSGYNMGPPAMSPQDFAMAMDAISRQPFDSDKLRIANQVLRGNRMFSLQVRDIMKLFAFDSYRVDFAEAAYPNVVDQQNFYLVNDALVFSSSIAELVDFTNHAGFNGGGTWTGSYGGSNGSGGHHHHDGPCSSACGGGYGQNGYYGGGQNCGTVVYGNGNGVSYSGGMNTVPAVPMCGMCNGYHAVNIVCEHEFSSIASAICNRPFDCDKLLVAKQAANGKLLSADQVRRIMGLFTFESTKLDFAKWAYHTTLDPQNYYIVNDAFTFSSSIRALDDFIRHG